MSFLKKNKTLVAGSSVAAISMIPMAAFALPPDFTALTGAIDLSTVGAAVLGVMASIAGIVVLVRGGQMILSALKRN